MRQLLKHDLDLCVESLPVYVTRVLKEFPGQAFVAGGYIRSVISRMPIKDVDIFSMSPVVAEKVAYSIVGGNGEMLYETENAFTVKDSRPIVQSIRRWSGETITGCLNTFDITTAKAAIWWERGEWFGLCHENYYAHLMAKRAVYETPSQDIDAGGSLLRMIALAKRGYDIDEASLSECLYRLVMSLEWNKFSQANGLVATQMIREKFIGRGES